MRRIFSIGLLITIIFAFAACSTAENNSPGETPVPVVTGTDEDIVIAEAVLLANEKRIVSFQSSGFIKNIVVDEGDEVAEGDLLATLDEIDAQLAVDQAEAALHQVKAQLARLTASPRDTDVAVLQAQILSTQSVITQTITQRDQFFSGTTEAQIAAAEANLAAAVAERVVALKRHDDTMKCYDIPGTDEKTCPALGDPEEQARYALIAAEQAVAAAEAQLAALTPASRAQIRTANAAISVAKAQETLASSQLEQLIAGAAAEEIDAANAAVQQAQVALHMAELALERTALYSPISGTVTSIFADPGDAIASGQGILSIATTETLQVSTVDLTELNVVKLDAGQAVEVLVDALPGEILNGHISEISLESVDYRGDVTYPVLIDLDETDPRLRLGMTTEVHIKLP
jgi:multidrug efflux pump subunit AcrA (membrane-fusion protein)